LDEGEGVGKVGEDGVVDAGEEGEGGRRLRDVEG